MRLNSWKLSWLLSSETYKAGPLCRGCRHAATTCTQRWFPPSSFIICRTSDTTSRDGCIAVAKVTSARSHWSFENSVNALINDADWVASGPKLPSIGLRKRLSWLIGRKFTPVRSVLRHLWLPLHRHGLLYLSRLGQNCILASSKERPDFAFRRVRDQLLN